MYKKIVECNLEFPPFLSDKCKDMIRRLLTVNPKKRISIEEIKNHSFYQQGDLQIIRDKKLYNKEKINEKIINKMESIGFNKEVIMKNIEMNRHNNVTTTYFLLFKKYESSILIKKSKSEDIDKVMKANANDFTTSNRIEDAKFDANRNININIKYLKNFGNININITEPKGVVDKLTKNRHNSNRPNKKENVE